MIHLKIFLQTLPHMMEVHKITRLTNNMKGSSQNDASSQIELHKLMKAAKPEFGVSYLEGV